MSDQLFQQHLLKKTFLHCLGFAPLAKISWLYLCSLFLGLIFFLFDWSICLFFCQYYTILTADCDFRKSWSCVSLLTLFSFSIQLVWVFCLSIQTSEWICHHPLKKKKNLLEFWLDLCWMYTSSWEKLTSYWVFLSMNMECLSHLFSSLISFIRGL